MTSEVYRWSELTKYLRQEQWTAFDAAHILSDVDLEFMGWEGGLEGMHSHYVESQTALRYAKVHQLYTFTDTDCPKGCCVITDRRKEHAPYVRRIERAILDKLEIMFTAWPDGFQHIKKTPKQWVKWAVKKRYTINWLEWALNEKLLPESLRGLGEGPSQSSQSEQVRNLAVNGIPPDSESSLDVDTPLDDKSVSTEYLEQPCVSVNEIASLFDPLPRAAIAAIFTIPSLSTKKDDHEGESGRAKNASVMNEAERNWNEWNKLFERAARNGLTNARAPKTGTEKTNARGHLYNPFLIGEWLITHHKNFYLDRGYISRKLAKNLPPRSRGLEYMLTGSDD